MSRLAEGCATKSHCFSKSPDCFGTFFPFFLCGSAAALYPRARFLRVRYSQIIWHLEGVLAASLICSLTPLDGASPTNRKGMLIPLWGGHSPTSEFLCKKGINFTAPHPGFPVLFQSNQILLSPALWDITFFNTCQKQLMVRVFFFPYLFSEEKLIVNIQTSPLMLHFLERQKTESGNIRDRKCLSDCQDTFHSVMKDGKCQCKQQRDQRLEELAWGGQKFPLFHVRSILPSLLNPWLQDPLCSSSLPHPVIWLPLHPPSVFFSQCMDGKEQTQSLDLMGALYKTLCRSKSLSFTFLPCNTKIGIKTTKVAKEF